MDTCWALAQENAHSRGETGALVRTIERTPPTPFFITLLCTFVPATCRQWNSTSVLCMTVTPVNCTIEQLSVPTLMGWIYIIVENLVSHSKPSECNSHTAHLFLRKGHTKAILIISF